MRIRFFVMGIKAQLVELSTDGRMVRCAFSRLLLKPICGHHVLGKIDYNLRGEERVEAWLLHKEIC